MLSRRGARLADSPSVPEYVLAHFERSEEPWDPRERPDGYVALCIAENRLMWDVLSARLGDVGVVPERVLGYDAMIGALPFREQLASFMGRRILNRPVDPEHLAVVAGAGSVLELLFYAIADPGDAVLVPTPSYSGFWADLETRDELVIVPVNRSADDDYRLSPDALDAALEGSKTPVRALLFTTPDNPLGRVFSPDELTGVLDWAHRRGIHVVFDEVYALSVFGERPFVSVATLRASLGPRVHVVWAFSKDFGASGLRCGVLYSENARLLQAVDGLAYWSACSGDTQYRLGALVADEPWVDGYITEMQTRLRRAYERTRTALDAAGIKHLPADAGIFLMCDLRPFLDESSWAGEDALWRRMISVANVNLTPGSACRATEPGFFRLCYASEPTDAVVAAIGRLGRVLATEV
jgi:aspartate/methionine/tyrosine aminotransferase